MAASTTGDERSAAERDRLAAERTNLANERTLLAYVRTSLALSAGGISVIELLQTLLHMAFGVVLLIAAAALLAVGVMRFGRSRERISTARTDEKLRK